VTKETQHQIFGEWLTNHKGIFFKVARAYAFTPMDQDDLFQEISLQVWNSVPSFRGEAAVGTWLYRIALNTAIKWSSKAKKQVTAAALETVQHLLQENRMAVNDRLQWLYQEISRLNSIDRSLTLLLLDDFSYKEMADILGISLSNVGVKINRIKKLLISKSKKYVDHGI